MHVMRREERVPARLFRITTLESSHTKSMCRRITAARCGNGDRSGEPFGLMAYGTEAMSTLRIEKGHIVVGPEADGRTTADDLGLGKLLNAGKWCIGKPLHERDALKAAGRWQLVGLTVVGDAPNATKALKGAKIVADPDRPPPNPMRPRDICSSPEPDAWIALALVPMWPRPTANAVAFSPLAARGARPRGSPCFIDPDEPGCVVNGPS